jgi:predicted ATPase
MLIKSLQIRNLLSFGPDSEPLELGPLNVLIGPNGSGKSNLIEAISLLRSAPSSLARTIREGGGIGEWLFKGGEQAPKASLEAVIDNPGGNQALRHRIDLTERGSRLEVVDERIENEFAYGGHARPYLLFSYEEGRPVLNVRGENERRLERTEMDPEASVLAQVRDRWAYPELTYLSTSYEAIRIYRDWTFGRSATPRLPQRTDLPNEDLLEDGQNLGLVLNRLRQSPKVRKQLFEKLSDLNDDVGEFNIRIEESTVLITLEEREVVIPATRLSDGTLRYLFLLAVLCDPEPPPLVVIEEPELGLHPDILLPLARLLEAASERTQLIITTHSDLLISHLTDRPEAVVVFEKEDQQTRARRLSAKDLEKWAESYRLGELWLSGDLGGTRW